MNVEALHYDFKLKFNRVDTLSNYDFNVAEIDWLLNEAQLLFIKRRFTDSNPKKEGFENTTKRIADLSTLVIKYPDQPDIPVTTSNGLTELNLSLLKYPYLYFISGEALHLKSDCTTIIPLRFISHNRIKDTKRDPFNKPSVSELPFNFGKSTNSNGTSIYIYNQDIPLTNVRLEYLRRPPQVSLGNYTFIDGVIYPPTSLLVPESVHSEVVDIAVQIASMNLESPEYINLKSQKTFIHE